MSRQAALFIVLWPWILWSQDSGSLPERKRMPRIITKLPSSVECKSPNETTHIYAINGIYECDEADVSQIEGVLQGMLPNCSSFRINLKAGNCVFTTTTKLDSVELSYAIDDMADLAGVMPFWLELTARDWPVSDSFAPDRYTISKIKDQELSLSGVAWFGIAKGMPFDVPVSFGGPETGKLRIVPATSYCMCHQRFTLRIVNPTNEVIWSHSKELFGSLHVAITDTDNDSVHEVLIKRYDHGKLDYFTLTLNRE
jgi:hypothetical protein